MMKTVTYKGEVLHRNSEAYRLLEEAQKSGKAVDMAKYNEHIKYVHKQFLKLCGLTDAQTYNYPA